MSYLSARETAEKWGVNVSLVKRCHFEELQYIELITFPGNAGSIIYLKNYLETMFQFPHSSIDKMKVSETFRLRISDEYDYQNQQPPRVSPQDTPVSAWNNGMGWFELIDPETYQVFRVSSLP